MVAAVSRKLSATNDPEEAHFGSEYLNNNNARDMLEHGSTGGWYVVLSLPPQVFIAATLSRANRKPALADSRMRLSMH